MKRVVRGPIATGLLLAVGLAITAAAPAEQGSKDKGCSLRTLKGTYLFAYPGFQIVDGQQVPFAFAGHDRYDGEGTLTGVGSFSVNGSISRSATYTGSYTVNPDCTGSSIIVDDSTGETQHFDTFFGRDGDEISFVQTDPGSVAVSIERRITKKDSD